MLEIAAYFKSVGLGATRISCVFVALLEKKDRGVFQNGASAGKIRIYNLSQWIVVEL